MKKIIFLLLAASLLLAACQPAPTAGGAGTGSAPGPTAAGLEPSTAPARTPTRTAAPTRPPLPTPTPAPTRPGGAVDLSAAALSGAFPALSAGLPFSGRLAQVVTVSGSAFLMAADFKAGTAWQLGAKLPAEVSALKWSPSGKVLAVFFAGGKGQTYLADGTLSGTSEVTSSAEWNAQDQLEPGRFQVVVSASGDRAWIDYETGLAHIEQAAQPGKELTYPLEPQKSDKIYQALAWVPGSDLLLGGYIQGGSSAMLLGPALFTLDTKTGAVKDLGTHLRSISQLAWHPAEKGLALIAETGTHELIGAQRLALLNVLTGQKSYPLPNQEASISWPSFTPDGKAAIFASYLPPELAGPGHPLGALAIYQVTLATGELKRLTTPPAGAQDHHPRLLADGVHFIYYRISSAGAVLTARLAALDGSPADAALSAPLSAPPCYTSPANCVWESVIAISEK